MNIACGFDHAGVVLSDRIVAAVRDSGHLPIDLGMTDDYPQITVILAREILNGRADRGILVCGSGAGVAVAASKIRGIRAATIHDSYTAHQGVEHDNLNVACLGSRVVGPELAVEIVQIFISSTFSGETRHVRRLAEVTEIELRGVQGTVGVHDQPPS